MVSVLERVHCTDTLTEGGRLNYRGHQDSQGKKTNCFLREQTLSALLYIQRRNKLHNMCFSWSLIVFTSMYPAWVTFDENVSNRDTFESMQG